MELLIDHDYKVFGKVTSANSSDGMVNIGVFVLDGSTTNLKIKDKELIEKVNVGDVYYFSFRHLFNGTREYSLVNEITHIFKMPFSDELEKAAHFFYPSAPADFMRIREKIDGCIASIENKIIRDVTSAIYEKYKKNFYIYPAAQKMHHAYIGGLALHTSTMLELAQAIAAIYEFLTKDLLFAGIILHDVLKVVEFTEPVAPDYSVKGSLIGHIVMSCLEIEVVSKELGYQDSEEVLLLEHIVLSHHGQLNFGSPKRPSTLEALVVSMIDLLDSKVQTVFEELQALKPGELTQPLVALERNRFYKPRKI